MTTQTLETALTALRNVSTWGEIGDMRGQISNAIAELERELSPSSRSEPLFRRMAAAVQARANCASDLHKLRSGLPGAPHESFLPLREEWFERWTERVESWTREYMPSGSGFDCGTKLDWTESNGSKLVFYTEFHHMDSHGSYDGWTEHRVTVRPSFDGFEMAISGRNRNEIKDVISEAFDVALRTPIRLEPVKRSEPVQA